jgi:hypothetical protein
MAVRMKDIARDLGVSVVTISKVLRRHPKTTRSTGVSPTLDLIGIGVFALFTGTRKDAT